MESGKRKTAGFRRACNKRLRVAFCRLADSSRHWHPWAQDLYAQARQRGHEHPRAIRTARTRLVSRRVAMLAQPHRYDPARHRALQRHITVTIPSPSGPGPTSTPPGGWPDPISVDPIGRQHRRRTAPDHAHRYAQTGRLTQDVFGDEALAEPGRPRYRYATTNPVVSSATLRATPWSPTRS